MPVEDPAAGVQGEVLALVVPARLSRQGNPVPGYVEVPEHEHLGPDEARALARKLDTAADHVEAWDAELVPTLERQAEINEKFLGGSA